MTTIQRGRRRCDATCQCAKGRECSCICGGKNHGKEWKDILDPEDIEEVEWHPPRLPKHKRQQLPLFEGVPAW